MEPATTAPASDIPSEVPSQQQPPVMSDDAPSIPPSPTLYCQNLSEKIKKAALKKALYSAFSPYGKVIDIVHCRTESLRGQAWVVFNNVASATTAMASMQSFLLFDRPLRVSFAKDKSHATAKVEGTFKVVPQAGVKRGPSEAKSQSNKRARTEAPTGGSGSGSGSSSSSSSSGNSGLGMVPPMPPPPPRNTLPSKTLLVQGLPTTLTAEALTEMIQSLFGQYAGLVDVKVVAQRGLAFVDFNSESAASPALQGLQNFKLDGSTTLQVTYARAS